MVGHAIDDDRLLLFSLDDARDVFVQFILPCPAYDVAAPFDGKDHVNLDLRKRPRNIMSLLRSSDADLV